MYKAFIHPLGTRSLAFRLNAIVIVSMFIALSSIGVTLFLSWQLEGVPLRLTMQAACECVPII